MTDWPGGPPLDGDTGPRIGVDGIDGSGDAPIGIGAAEAHGGCFAGGCFQGRGLYSGGFHDRGFGWDYDPDYGYNDYGQPYASQNPHHCSGLAGYYPYVTQYNTGWQTVLAN